MVEEGPGEKPLIDSRHDQSLPWRRYEHATKRGNVLRDVLPLVGPCARSCCPHHSADNELPAQLWPCISVDVAEQPWRPAWLLITPNCCGATSVSRTLVCRGCISTTTGVRVTYVQRRTETKANSVQLISCGVSFCTSLITSNVRKYTVWPRLSVWGWGGGVAPASELVGIADIRSTLTGALRHGEFHELALHVNPTAVLSASSRRQSCT